MKHEARVSRICTLYQEGMTLMQLAKRFRISAMFVRKILMEQGIARRRRGRPCVMRPPKPPYVAFIPDDGRAQEMFDLYKSGKTLQEVGTEFGVSRERVRQIIHKRFGATFADGGAAIQAIIRAFRKAEKRAEIRAAKIKRAEALCGCSFELIAELGEGYTPYASIQMAPFSPLAKWTQQMRSAISRGIEWKMPLADWWRIWQESGKWEQRGRGQGYCMARHGDSGPYSPDNVYICTIAQNFSDSYITKPAAARRIKAQQNRDARVQ